MVSFVVHRSSQGASTRLVADARWALAVRAMVAGHDAGGREATDLIDSFVTLMGSELERRTEDLNTQRERIASVIQTSVEGHSDAGVVFTLFTNASSNTVRVFALGPHRTFLARRGVSTTVLAPHSLAEQIRTTGTTPAPEHALISLRIGNAQSSAGDIDAAEVELAPDTWLVAQLDDRAPLLNLSALPSSPEAMVDELRTCARDVPNMAEDWLLATLDPERSRVADARFQ